MKLTLNGKTDIPVLMDNGRRLKAVRLQIFAMKGKIPSRFSCNDEFFTCQDGVFIAMVYSIRYNHSNPGNYIVYNGSKEIPLVLQDGRKAKLARISMFALKNPKPILRILTPENEELIDTRMYEITWSSVYAKSTDTLTIYLYSNGIPSILAEDVQATSNSYMLDTLGLTPGQYTIEIVLDRISSIKDSVGFSLAKSISIDDISSTVISSPYEITWNSVNIPESSQVRLELYDDEFFVRILDTVDNTGSYMWDNTVDVPSLAYSVLIVLEGMETVWDRTSQFELARSITLTSPVNGIITNAYHTITWETVNISSDRTIKIEYIGLTSGLIAEVLNTGSYVWDNTGLDAGDYQIKLSLVEV
jgi:hypothetical protein